MESAEEPSDWIDVARQIEDEKATERIQIVATPRWVTRIEGWRRKQPKIPSKSDAIRMLVDQMLDEHEKREADKRE